MNQPPSSIHRAVGCIDCRGGYRGEEVLFEGIPMSPDLREILAESDEHPHLETLLRGFYETVSFPFTVELGKGQK